MAIIEVISIEDLEAQCRKIMKEKKEKAHFFVEDDILARKQEEEKL